MRTLVEIPDEHIAELNRLAARAKVSRAALVRQAVADLLAAKRKTGGNARDAALGLWAGMEEDGPACPPLMR